MHRKDIDNSGRVARFHASAGAGLLYALSILLTAQAPLHAAVDPDIFDGRVSQGQAGPRSSGSGGGGAPEASPEAGPTPEGGAGNMSPEGQETSQSASGAESSERDFGEIGQVGGGQTVSTSNQPVRGSGSASSSTDSAGTHGSNSSSGSGSSGTSTEAGDQSPGTGGSSGSGEPRDFSEIGGISSTGKSVEVNSSKATPVGQSPSTSTETGDSSAGASNNQNNQSQGGTGGSGSQPSSGSGAGDYGDTIPVGI